MSNVAVGCVLLANGDAAVVPLALALYALGGGLFKPNIYAIAGAGQVSSVSLVEPRQVGMALFGPYLLGVELASLLLLAGLASAVGRTLTGELKLARDVLAAAPSR